MSKLKRSMGAEVLENVPISSMLPSVKKVAARGNPCGPGCWQVRGGCDCGGQVMRALRGALSGISGGPRGNRVSLYAMGGVDVYTAASKCSEITSGDPYRVPGNFCVGNDGSKMTFDSAGNAISAGPDLLTWGLYAGAALLAYKVLTKKKRR